MKWDDIGKWKCVGAREFVNKYSDMHLTGFEEIIALLTDLWKEASLTDESDKIAMLMYLTWMDWFYRLTMKDSKSRHMLVATRYNRELICTGKDDDLRTWNISMIKLKQKEKVWEEIKSEESREAA